MKIYTILYNQFVICNVQVDLFGDVITIVENIEFEEFYETVHMRFDQNQAKILFDNKKDWVYTDLPTLN